MFLIGIEHVVGLLVEEVVAGSERGNAHQGCGNAAAYQASPVIIFIFRNQRMSIAEGVSRRWSDPLAIPRAMRNS